LLREATTGKAGDNQHTTKKVDDNITDQRKTGTNQHTKKEDTYNISTQHGTSKSYTLDRIAREDPDLDPFTTLDPTDGPAEYDPAH